MKFSLLLIILISGLATLTACMSRPTYVSFRHDTQVPADDVFRRGDPAAVKWTGNIEQGSVCELKSRKADVMYVLCPIAIDASRVDVVKPPSE